MATRIEDYSNLWGSPVKRELPVFELRFFVTSEI
jgi:hypothetical protein